MKSLIATIILSMLFLGSALGQGYPPAPAAAPTPAPAPAPQPAPAPPSGSGGLGGTCGMYLSACCPGGTCNRGFVCTSGLSATPVCYTPRCTDTQQCLQYAYWTECVVSQMNCNACGFIGQHTCSYQAGPIFRDQPCYQGYPSGGYCVGSLPAPPSAPVAAPTAPAPAPSSSTQGPFATYGLQQMILK